jgi:hypothetical protein
MATGTVQTIVVCAASSTPAAPCPAGQAPATFSAYVLDPAQALYFDAVTAPFDYGVAMSFWTAAFITTLVLYVTPRILGEIIAMVRNNL